MAKPLSIYDQLTGVKIADATTAQLDFTKNTFIDEQSISWWKGPITISKVVEASRTYAGGSIPIPESGKVTSSSIGTSEVGTFQPPGTEVWQVNAIQIVANAGTPTVMINLTDGATLCLMHSGSSSTAPSSFFPFEAPFTISNSLYLSVMNTDGSNTIVATIAYSKVSL